MWAKVDISTEDKNLYSIYYKKWFFHKWTRIGKNYRYLEDAIQTACWLKKQNRLDLPKYNGLLVKLDFSIEFKKQDNDITIPGCYAIYNRKSIFHKWKEKSTYADLNIAFWRLEDYYNNKLPIDI